MDTPPVYAPPGVLFIYMEQLFKFCFMFLVGALFVGLPKYLNNLPKNEEISRRYLWSAVLMHGGMSCMAGTALIFLPTENLIVLGGLSALFSWIGGETIKKVAVAYAASKLGIKINGNNGNGKSKPLDSSENAPTDKND